MSLFCRTYKCLRQSDTLDLDKLSDFKCFDDNDCANDLSGMVCTNYSHLQSSVKYCNCPPGYAYNTNDCKCEPAELCWSSKVRSKWRFHEKKKLLTDALRLHCLDFAITSLFSTRLTSFGTGWHLWRERKKSIRIFFCIQQNDSTLVNDKKIAL